MKNVLALVAVAGLAAVANAQIGLNLQFNTVSADSDAGWSDSINANPGTTVYVRVIETIPDSFYGIGGARFNIVSNNAGGWDNGGNDAIDLSAAKGAIFDGRMAGFDFGGQTQQVFEAASSVRIDAKGDNGNSTAAGISVAQNTPGALGTNFNTNKSAVVYKFAVVLSGNAALRTLTFRIADGGSNGTPNQITSFTGYASQGSTSASQITGATGDTGNINIVPAPASLALVGLGGLVAGRRRR